MAANPITGLVLHFRTPSSTINCLSALCSEGVVDIVLVDNSEDGGRSLQLMKAGIERLMKSGAAITFINPTFNLGFSAGVAAGLDFIRRERSGNVLLINSDAVLSTGALSEMVKALANSELVVPCVRDEMVGEPKPSGGFYHKYLALYLSEAVSGAFFYPSGCCMLIHRKILGANLFDKDFFFYGEDVHLGRKLIRHGWRAEICQTAHIVHARSASAKNGSIFYEYHMARGHWLLAKKLSRNRLDCALCIAMRCITLSARACVRSLRAGSLLPWRALVVSATDILFSRCQSLTPPAEKETKFSGNKS